MKCANPASVPSAPRKTPAGITARRASRKALRLATDHRAVSHVVFFIVSAAIFIPVVGGMFLYMQDASESLVDPSAGLGTKATSLLHQLTSSPGMTNGPNPTPHWQDAGADLEVTEVGLRHVDSETLDYNKVDNLQRAALTADPANAFLDYEEMKAALRMDDSYDLHIRMYPLVSDPNVDPYGTLPIAGRHVAYVANLSNPSGRDDSIRLTAPVGEFRYPTALASKEIAALSDLGLGTGDVNAGFDGSFYQPHSALVPTPYLGNPYTNAGVKHGDVIADTDRPYNDGSGEVAYPALFWDRYLKDGDDFRYDAIVFGGGVNLQRWADTLAASEDPEALTKFVNEGGTVIFMGRTNDPGDFATQCEAATGDACLFWQTGSLAGTTSVDDTNQILATPNQLSPGGYGATDLWPVCDRTGLSPAGVNEADGFIPVIVDGSTWNAATKCFDTELGATSSDRYGINGGTVIVNSWDLTPASQTETSRVMANLLSYGVLRTAYLDFGPPIPNDAPVESATRMLLMQMPDGEYMEIRILLYLWRT